MPDLYEKYQEDRLLTKMEQRVLAKVQNSQRQAQEEQEAKTYIDHFSNRLKSEFPEILKQDSETYKSFQPRMTEIAQEYPALIKDPAKVHLALRLVKTEQELFNLRRKLRGEVKEEVNKNRAAKRSAAMAGQANAIGKTNAEDDPWSQPPEWETRNQT